MPHFHIKRKRGRPYLYVREMARISGKPKVVSQTYIGSPKRVAALATGQDQEEVRLKVEEFGALWLAQQIDHDINLACIVDSIVSRGDRETGPTVGEYFLYSVWNRMVKATSKNRLPEWYKRTAIQHIRPVEINKLTSQHYWEKWDRISENILQKIAQQFFKRVWKTISTNADCLLFDTTNYYTYMASNTPSDLVQRGKNKDGRHHLRQVGLGLLVARESRLPLYYSAYPGNFHDSRLFEAVMDEMFGVVCGLNKNKECLTVVIDKGMNSEVNYAWIDGHSHIHFVTTYSAHFACELAAIPADQFELVDTTKNRCLVIEGHPQERILAYRTKGVYWGRERAVVVTYNPATARKQSYTLDTKLEKVRQELLVMRAKVRKKMPHWREPETIQERYLRLCRRLHVSSDFYTLDFCQSKDGLSVRFHKNSYLVKQKRTMLGKSIIITDNTDWTTAEIVQTYLDRWQVEDRFRLSKNDDLVGTQPIRHWTDSKIRCHLFTCVAAMTYLRRLELKLEEAGIQRTADDVMEDMEHLHSVLTLDKGSRKARRYIETPTKSQAEILSAFGYYVNKKGVLQAKNR